MTSQAVLKETRTARIYRREDGIFLAVEMPVDTYTVAEAQENVSALAALAGGEPVLLIVDVRRARALSKEARSYFTGPHAGRLLRGLALWIGSPTSKVIGNFFISLSRPAVPVRLFTSEDEAAAWLKGLLR
jgi:hypothetical protein